MGYCDNFFFVMVVLLCLVGILVCWIKGYMFGEYKEVGNKNGSIYEVINNNVYFWVEVYFLEQGWVIFELIKGFINLVEFVFFDIKDFGSESSSLLEKIKEEQKEEKKQFENEEK